MKKRTAVIILVLAAVFLLAETASVITYPNEYKVIKTMGKISRVTTEPGFSLRIPFVQSETTISKSRQLYDIAPTEIYTSDKKKMEVDAYIICLHFSGGADRVPRRCSGYGGGGEHPL